MIILLHNEARKSLIEAWNKTHNAKKIAEFFPLIPAPFTDWKKECGKLVLWKQELPSAIEWAFSAVKASDCLGWFRSYDCVQ